MGTIVLREDLDNFSWIANSYEDDVPGQKIQDNNNLEPSPSQPPESKTDNL